ncbi:hypothetical protein AC578_6710 [Pseudocercospora eumusae]|uniref:Uncharacterized protein n=1 Tax=Pseudocercospora eumusae TaxID=321146 RepID=A0A139HI20_9PEZI|nr:hypothetical protein AC578_6710 [Pseudocercospora eumusae]
MKAMGTGKAADSGNFCCLTNGEEVNSTFCRAILVKGDEFTMSTGQCNMTSDRAYAIIKGRWEYDQDTQRVYS